MPTSIVLLTIRTHDFRPLAAYMTSHILAKCRNGAKGEEEAEAGDLGATVCRSVNNARPGAVSTNSHWVTETRIHTRQPGSVCLNSSCTYGASPTAGFTATLVKQSDAYGGILWKQTHYATLYWSSSHARNNFMSFWKNKIHLWLSQQVKNDPGISPMCLFLCMRIYWIIQGNVHIFKSCSEMKWNDRYSSPGFS